MPEKFDTIAKSAVDSVGNDLSKVIGLPSDIDHLSGEVIQVFTQKIIQQLLSFGTKILLALAIYFVGRWIINKVKRICTRIFENREIEPSLRTFFISLINISLIILLIISIINILGIETSSFVALFASAGVAIGLALSGTLQNFAGGVMVLLFKPYKVGDVIEAQGYTGTVKEIQIFNTILNTFDNKAIIIPNGGLATGIINNFSKENRRRIEWKFGIAYGDNYDHAQTLLIKLIESDPRILKEPAVPFIALHSLGDSSVNIIVRVWVDSSDYWGVYYELNEKVYKTFAKEGLNIPFPQMDIHIKQEK